MDVPSPYLGKLTPADVALAAALAEARGDYEKWEHVSRVQVDGCAVELHRRPLESGLFEYYAAGELPLSLEELVEVSGSTTAGVAWAHLV
jgi:hypothetical protein